jgi:hypothetical protein
MTVKAKYRKPRFSVPKSSHHFQIIRRRTVKANPCAENCAPGQPAMSDQKQCDAYSFSLDFVAPATNMEGTAVRTQTMEPCHDFS